MARRLMLILFGHLTCVPLSILNILNGRGRGQSRFEPEGRGVPRFLSHSIRLT